MPEVRTEAPDRCEERGDVDDGREHEQEDRVRRDLDARDAGDRAEPEPADQEEHRVRGSEASGYCHEGRDRDEEGEEELGCVQGGRRLALPMGVCCAP